MTNAAASQEPESIPVQRSSGAFDWADPLSLVAAVLGSLVVFDSPSFLAFVHADSLQLALTTWDFSTHDYAWEGFQFSRVPSLVPDLAIFATGQLLTGSWRFAFLAFGTLTFLGLALAAGWIIDSLTRCGWRTGTQAFLLLALPLLMLELPLTRASRHLEIFVPNGHGGPLALAFVALCVTWTCMQRIDIGWSLVLFALTTAGTISDPLFFIALTAPVLVVMAYRLRRGAITGKSAAFVLAPVLSGLAAGRLLDLLLQRELVPGIEWAKVPEHAWTFIKSPGELAAAAPLTVLLGFALPLALFLCYPFWRRLPGDRHGTADASALWWSLAATSVLGVVSTTALVYQRSEEYRYTMPLQWWPIVFAAALMVRALGHRGRYMIAPGLGGLAAALGFFYAWPGFHAPAIMSLHHPVEACLLDAQKTGGLKAGLGDYWNSRYIEASSDWRLQIDEIDRSGEARYFGNDRFWFTHDVHDGTHPPEYNYIVMANLDEGAIRAFYGAPSRTLDCPGSQVWVYDDSAALRRTLMRDSPALSPRS